MSVDTLGTAADSMSSAVLTGFVSSGLMNVKLVTIRSVHTCVKKALLPKWILHLKAVDF